MIRRKGYVSPCPGVGFWAVVKSYRVFWKVYLHVVICRNLDGSCSIVRFLGGLNEGCFYFFKRRVVRL